MATSRRDRLVPAAFFNYLEFWNVFNPNLGEG
jgi:hypothetical protein